jgi:DNA-binding protein HU-beta
MTNSNASQIPAPLAATNSKPSKARRSLALDAVIVRARQTLAALPALLAGIAAKDAHAAKVRIDDSWVSDYASVLATAEEASAGGSVARVDQKAATAEERQKGLELSLLLTDTRDVVATHNPDDLAAQQAYGRGEKIDPRRTSLLVNIAGAYLAAWDGKWKTPAVDAGVTQATMDKIQSLRDALSSADLAQHEVTLTNEDGTVNRAAALSLLRQMTAFAVKVVTNVFGRGSKQLRSLADPRPLTNRASARKAATKAKQAAAKTAKKAKKTARLAKPGARAAAVKGRAKRTAVKARAQALLTKPAAKAATKKAPAKKKAAKRAKRAK